MLNDIDAHLESLLDLAPAETALVVPETTEIAPITEELMERQDLKSDVDFVRQKMRSAVELGAEAMEDLLALSKTSQGFEHYTALASLIKSLNETNRNILDLHKSVIEIENTAPRETEPENVTNNLIVGNASEIMELIRTQLGTSRGLEAASRTIVLDANAPGLQS